MAEANAHDDVKALRADFSKLQTDIQNLTKTIGDISRHRVEDGIETVKQTGNRAAERMRAAASEANSIKDAGLAAAERQVIDHPVTSLLAAFAAGLVVGKLVDRR
jgi:ElaB/YqjD/DUF883 family membrane-anchored ribosome-binding protein